MKSYINLAVLNSVSTCKEALHHEVASTLKEEIQTQLSDFLKNLNLAGAASAATARVSTQPPASTDPTLFKATAPPPAEQNPPLVQGRSAFVPVGNQNRRNPAPTRAAGRPFNGNQQVSWNYQQHFPSPYMLPPPHISPYMSPGYRPPIKIDKWGLKFDGRTESLTVEDFVFRLEKLQSRYGCSWDEILRDFQQLLAGEAHDWFWQYQVDNPLNWPTLKAALLSHFQNPMTDLEKVRNILDRKQYPQESSEEFFAAINRMRFQLKMPIPEADMVKIIKRNLNDRIRNLVFPQAIFSLDQLRYVCKEAEAAFQRKDPRDLPKPAGRPTARYGLSELEYEEERHSPDEQLAAYQFGGARSRNPPRKYADTSNLVCWNCKEPGHTYFDCESDIRNLFCFKCGKEGVKTPSCPRCHPENRLRDAKAPGESRTTQNLYPQ